VPELFWLVPIVGFLTGLIASVLGIGGGVIMVPFMVLGLGLPTSIAVGTSMAVIPFLTASATIRHAKDGRVLWGLGLTLEAFTAPAVLIGVYFMSFLKEQQKEHYVAYALGAALILVSARIFYTSLKTKRLCETTVETRLRWFAPPISFLAGFVAGLLGIGGGALKVPVMLACRCPIHFAVATSAMMITVTCAIGAVGHTISGNVSFVHFLLFLSAVVGAQVGAYRLKEIRPRFLRILFASFMLYVAFRLLLR